MGRLLHAAIPKRSPCQSTTGVYSSSRIYSRENYNSDRVNYPGGATCNKSTSQISLRKFPRDRRIHTNVKNTGNTGRRESGVCLCSECVCVCVCVCVSRSIADKSFILNKSIFPGGFRSIGSSPFALFNSVLPRYERVSAQLWPVPLRVYASFQYRVKPQLRENRWLPVRSQYPAFVVSPFVETGRD